MNTVYAEFKGFSIETKKHSKEHAMPRPHYHKAYEIYIPLGGNSTLMIGDEIISLDKSSIALISPSVPHGNFSKSEHERTVIYFDEDFLNLFLTPLAQKALLNCFSFKLLAPSQANLTTLHKLVSDLQNIDITKQTSPNIFLLLNQILIILNGSPKAEIRSPQVIEGTLGAVLSYININFTTIKSISELASSFFISESYLCRLFKDGTGLTVTQYINTLKINLACELLKSTKKPTTEICFDVGYNSYTYFCKNFIKLMGESPHRYRKNNS